jgi:hypothetical protein
MSLACGRYDAAFALDDPDALVDASLSCPACLDAATRTAVGLVAGVLEASCLCLTCSSTWSLALRPQQLLRLSLDPPPCSEVRWSAALPPELLPFDFEDFDDA